MASCRGRQKPLVAIIGATGTGKSDLAVALARRFNGEVINADAMQMYKGLPIITNKISKEEQEGVPHHLLDGIGLTEPTWTVTHFTHHALRVVDEIHQRNRLPIVIGGTNYYLQSLIFPDRLAVPGNNCDQQAGAIDDVLPDIHSRDRWPILQEPTENILAKLRAVDPVMADRWHPNERRKIIRSLEIWLETGKKASEIYREQASRIMNARSSSDGLPDADSDREPSKLHNIRFPTLVLWVHAEQEKLRERLDRRVDNMIERGLLSEIETLEAYLKSRAEANEPVDTTRGIWTSIGYKEFHTYSAALHSGDMDEGHLSSLRDNAIEKTKVATKQYAKRQVKWIRSKFLNSMINAQAMRSMFLLDGTARENWQEEVAGPSERLVQQFLSGTEAPDPSSMSAIAREMLRPVREYELSARQDLWVRKTCEFCDITIITENEWELHSKSRRHRKRISKAKKAILKAQGANLEQEAETDNSDETAVASPTEM